MAGQVVAIYQRPCIPCSRSDLPSSRMMYSVVLALLSALVCGCGGDDISNRPAPRRLVQQPPQIDQPAPPAQAPPDAAPQPGPGMMDAPPGVDQPKPLSKRDDDVSKWKTPDYLSAKKENDRRLLEAVRYIAENEKFVGNEQIALVLIQLLTAEEPKEESKKDNDANSRPGMGGPPHLMFADPEMGGYGPASQAARLDPQTIEAVIAALAANGSKPAKKAIRDVVLGTLKTDDDTVAAKNALQALADDISPENETVLFRALTEAETLRPEDKNSPGQTPFTGPGGMGGGYGAGGPLSADALRQMTLELVEVAASEDFRTKLAEYSLSSNQKMTPAAFTAISGMLIQSHPNNVGPQLMLFQSSAPSLTTKARLASFFTEYSEIALGHLLGVFKHTKPFQFGPTPAGETQSHGGWAATAPARTGWGSGAAAGAQPFDMPPGMGPNPMIDRSMGGGYPGQPDQRLDTKQLMAADPEMPARIAKKLWSPQVTRMVGDRLAQASSLQEANMVIPLARAMPVDEIRARLYRLMQTHWVNGSQLFLSGVQIPGGGAAPGGMMPDGGRGTMGLEGIGYGGMGYGGMGVPGAGQNMDAAEFDKPLCDPGFLLLVKMLPINEKRSGRGARYNGNEVQQPGITGMGMTGAGLSPIEDWQKVQVNLFYHFAAAFQAAARLNRSAGNVGALPVELHTNEGIDTRFDLKWPELAAGASGLALDPIEIHYVKISDTADASKVWKTYSRGLRTKGRMLEQGRVALLDTVKDASTPGRKLSIDVLITRQPPGMAAAAPPPPGERKSRKNPGEPLSVEILTIEMKDPSGTAAPAEAAKPEPKTDAAQDEDAERAARLKALREKAAAAKLKR